MYAINKMIILYNQLENDDFYKNAISQVLKNLESVPALSTYDLAEKCFVSPATILRLSRKLGYESYSEFKLSVSMGLKEIRDNIIFSYDEIHWEEQFLSQGINHMIDTLERIRDSVSEEALLQTAAYLSESEHIAFFTTAGSAILRNIQMRLLVSGKEVCIARTLEEQKQYITGLHPDSVVIFIEMRFTDNREYLEMFSQIKEKGCRSVFISNVPVNTHTKDVDQYIGYKGSSFRRDGLGIETILASIAVAYTNFHRHK